MTELLELPPGRGCSRSAPARDTRAPSSAEIAAEVYSIEILPELARRRRTKLKELGYANVDVRAGDGYRGWPEHAPFDGIIVTAAPERIPEPLLDQLAPGGGMVIPVGGFFQELKVFTKEPDGRVTEKDIIPVRFVPMTGEIEKRRRRRALDYPASSGGSSTGSPGPAGPRDDRRLRSSRRPPGSRPRRG